MIVEPFTIEIPERTLSDLRERILATRWPPPSPEPGWAQGTELECLRDLLGYWADGFDWRAQERRLNEYPQFVADGIHFVHVKENRKQLTDPDRVTEWFTDVSPLVLAPIVTAAILGEDNVLKHRAQLLAGHPP